jgi:hypothetical protein
LSSKFTTKVATIHGDSEEIASALNEKFRVLVVVVVVVVVVRGVLPLSGTAEPGSLCEST